MYQLNSPQFTPQQAFRAAPENAWPAEGVRMTFVSNYDENAWDLMIRVPGDAGLRVPSVVRMNETDGVFAAGDGR